jgi:hypothetical protein
VSHECERRRRSAASLIGDDEVKYLYCSHGCVRLSNQNISKLFELTTQARYAGVTILVSFT